MLTNNEKSIRILHVCYSDDEGGAGIAALRLHCTLNEYSNGVESMMLVVNKHSVDPNVYVLSGIYRFANKIFNKLSQSVIKIYKLFGGLSYIHYCSLNIFPSNVVRIINDMAPDIVHLHWINGEMLPIYDLDKIKSPVVWTMHDSWVINGMSHHSNSPRNDYIIYNGLSSEDSCINLENFIFRLKMHSGLGNFIYIAPSKWMYECAKKSYLLSKSQVEVIPNVLSSRVVSNMIAKPEYEEVVFCLGAVNPFSNPNKGFNDLIRILDHFANNRRAKFLIFGASHLPESLAHVKNIKAVGYIDDESRMADLMFSSHWFLSFSKVESFGLTACESIANGTPVICYNTSGLRDIVADGISGYLCDDIESFIAKIDLALSLTEKEYIRLSRTAKSYYQEFFSQKVVVEKFLDLYKRAIQ
ncbi:glycosyltransferase [Aeromonas veronii]